MIENSLEQQLSIEEGRAILQGGLGKYELELVTSFCTPLYCAMRDAEGNVFSRNGTAFFLDAGERLFAVTAAHVVEGLLALRQTHGAGPLRLAGNGTSVELDWPGRLIDIHSAIDIATFQVDASEVKALGKQVLTGVQSQWPPGPPMERCGIYYSGYPGIGTRRPSNNEALFGAAPGAGIATSVSELDVSTLIEREHLIPMLGGGIPPENFDFRGISGGPMLMVIQGRLRSWALAGVIYQGPNTSEDAEQAIAGLEIIRARRARFILPDGRLDTALWHSLSPVR